MHWNPLAAVSARKVNEEKMMLKKMLTVFPLMLCALVGRSESITIGDFTYSYSLSTKEGSITKYNGSSESVVIPSTFSVPETYRDNDGETHTRYHIIKVTAIGSSVFEKNIAIRSVTFSSDLTSIGWRAFSGCTNLTEISSIEGIKSIGASAFYNCYKIPFGDLVLDNVESIGDSAFVGCNIRSLKIGDKLGSMGIYVFEYCGNLKSVDITGNGNCRLNGYNGVFNNCTALESVVFGDGIVEVSSGGSAVLYGCYALKDVSFGARITSIPALILKDRKSLGTVFFSSAVTSIGGEAFSGCTNLTEMSSIENVMRIDSSAFYNCYRIPFGDLVLDGVESIGKRAFVGCNINSVRIGDKLNELWPCAFESCGNLKSIEIIGNGSCRFVNVFEGVFSNCGALESVVLGDGITEWTSYNPSVFPGCYALKEVSFGAQIKTIPSGVLKDRKSLRSVTFSSAVTSIGGEAFSGCTNLTEISLLENVKTIGSYAFQNCYGIKSVKFGSSLTSIGSSVFSSCTNASSFAFAGAPPSVGSSAFKNVKSGAIGTYTATHAAAWEAVIDSKGYWNGLKMKPSYYTVIYDANNGTGETFSQTVEWGEPQQAADGTFTWEGHYFMGWAFAPDGEVACVADDTLTEPTDDNVVTLYAQWATVTPEFADWSVGSITLSAMGFTGNSLEDISISYCNANIGGIVWLTPEDGEITKAWSADGKTLLVTDNKFSRRLDGVCPIKYRIVDKFGHAVDSPSTRSRHGIIVGLGKYDPGFKAVCEQNGIVVNELSQLRNEAELAFDILVNCGGGVNSEKPLVDSSARLVDISNAWKDLAQNKVAPGDVVFFVISTHGARSGKVVAYDGYYTREAFQNDLEPFRAGKLSSVKVVAILMNCHSEKMTSEEGDIAEEYGSVCTPNIIYVTEAASEETGKTMKEYSQFGEFFFNQGLKNRQADAQTSLQGLDVDGTFGDRDGKRDGRIDLLECTKYAKEFAIGRSDHDVTNVQYDPSKASIMADTILVADSAPVDAVVPLAAPAECKVSKDSNGLIVRWSNVEGATHYIVNWVRAGENYDSHWAFLLENKWDTESAITFKTADMADAKYRQNYVPLGNDTEYLFWVVAVNGAGKSLARLSDIERTFVAKKDVTYTVDFFAPGAKSQPAPIYVSAGCQIGSLPTPERVGREFLGWISVEDNSELTPFTVITADARYRAHWSDLEYTITLDWLRGHPAAFSISGGDVSAASVLTAANGCRTVGECYELGIDPEDPNEDLKIAEFKMKDGKPEITLNHTKDGSGNSFEDRVKILGKAELSDAEWQEVPPEGNPAHRFFKVGVEMP